MTNPDVAFKRGPCKECGGSGKVPFSQIDDYLVIPRTRDCPTCNGTGKVYLLGEMVRRLCGYRVGGGVSAEGYEYPTHPTDCPICHGLEFTPSTELGDWVEAALSLPEVETVWLSKKGCDLVGDYGNSLIATGHDPNPLTALKLALGKALEGR